MAMQGATTPLEDILFEDCYDYDAFCPHDLLHFKSMEEWKNHHLEHHMDTKWKCPLCGIDSSAWHNYSFHVQTSQHQSVCPPPWICKLKKTPTCLDLSSRCRLRFGSKYQLIRHIRSAHPNYKVDLENKEHCNDKRRLKRSRSEFDMDTQNNLWSLPDHTLVEDRDGTSVHSCSNLSTPSVPSPPLPIPPPKRRKLTHRTDGDATNR